MKSTLVERSGRELDMPTAGDTVTVLIRPPSIGVKEAPSPYRWLTSFDIRDGRPEHENLHHYRVTTVWRVVAVNDGHAAVDALSGRLGEESRQEVWAISHHRWFDAAELWSTMQAEEAARRAAVAAQEIESPAAEDGSAGGLHAEDGRGALAGSVGAAATCKESLQVQPSVEIDERRVTRDEQPSEDDARRALR